MLASLSRPFSVLAVAMAVLCTSGCAQERAPINKVQANALDKTFFVGDPGNPSDDPTFYFRNFVVDASESQELVGIGSWGGVDRVKWEISETMLFARRAYGQNQGADDKGSGPGFPNGTVVAAYKILSHFDVKRAYNPQTGEELNIIEENTTDRPWYERDHFRADWSMNLVDSPQWSDMFVGKIFGDIKLTPISYYVNDPAQDDAPHFDANAGYFDVTSKFLVEPTPSSPAQTASLGVTIPICAYVGFVTGNAISNCDPQEAVVRSSFWRVDQVDPDGDFEPFANTRANLDVIGNPGGLGDSLSAGIVTPPRVSWDPGYGYVDANMTRLMHVHDIWKQSHETRGKCTTSDECPSLTGLKGSECLPSGECTIPCSYAARTDGDGNGTDDQCENKRTHYQGSQGSQCSLKNRCTIPYRDRETKPVAWWVNTDMPSELQDTFDGKGKKVSTGATEDVVYTWNQAIGLAVAHAREVECRRTLHTPDARSTCHAKYFDTKNPVEMVSYGGWGIERVKNREDIVVTCHNPVRDYDPDVCGDRGATARVGDLRHHFIFYWPWSSKAPWGGIANWNADPLTGQIIGAAATVMGRSATNAAAQIRDILMVANGELDMKDITDGVSASLYQTTLQKGQHPTALTAAEISRRTGVVDVQHAAQELALTLTGATATDRLAALRELKAHTTSDPGILSASLAEVQGLVQPLLGSSFEAQLLSPGWLVDAAGLDPSTPIDTTVLNRVSPLRGFDPARLGQMSRTAMQGMSQHGICTFAAGDGVGNPDIRGVARWYGDPVTGKHGDAALKRDFPKLAKASIGELSAQRASLIYSDLVAETYKGIALHEVGHALGMLHNFASSYDATNFDPQYWQLRTNEGQASASCNAVSRADGTPDSCMGPRFIDPETDDELGQADESRPGINYFGHTSTMEYQNERFFETVGLGQYDVMTMGALYGRVLETFDPDAADGVKLADQPDYGWLSYTQLTEDNLVSHTTALGTGPQAMHYTELARRINLFDPGRCRAATKDELAAGEWRVVHGKVCTPPPKDHAAWSDFIDDPGPKTTVAPDAPSAAGQVRWPYRWGENMNAYLHVNPFDSGADPYEVTQETIRKFDYSYPFTYFRRQRRDWFYDSIPGLTATRFFERLRAYHWVTARNNATLPSLAPGALEKLKATDDTVRANLLAATDMLDAITHAVLIPQAGDYGKADPKYQIGTDRQLYDAISGGSSRSIFTLDASSARFVDPDYDTGAQAGGSWDYLTWLRHAGFDVEKANAAMAITDGRPTLQIIERDTYLDGRHLYVTFRTDLAKSVDRMLGGVLSGDWETVAPYLSGTTGSPQMLAFGDDAPSRPKTAFLLFPNLGFRQQLGALIWAELFSRLGTDLSLANKLRIQLESTEGVIDIPDDQKIKFTDPRSGFTYMARLYGPDTIDGKAVDLGIGSRMLARANVLLAGAYQVELDADQKPVVDQYGRPTLTLDATGQPMPSTDDAAITAFGDYIGLVDTSVQVARLIGHGPL